MSSSSSSVRKSPLSQGSISTLRHTDGKSQRDQRESPYHCRNSGERASCRNCSSRLSSDISCFSWSTCETNIMSPSVASRSSSPSTQSSRNISKYSRYELKWLPMDYWERSPECREAKLNHMDRMDYFCGDAREYLILQTTLWNRYITLETNMFPYDTPPGIQHWTLWCRDEMTHREICRYVESWLRRHMPNVRRWNYDSNSGDRSIDIFHVHVYIETIPSNVVSEKFCSPTRNPETRKSSPLSSGSGSSRSWDGNVDQDPSHLIAVSGDVLSDSDSYISDDSQHLSKENI